jgi:RNA polymerase sigma-70 factor (ECF subfamily)
LKIAEMIDDPVNRVRQTLDETYRNQSRKIFATLVRLIGDFDLAEEALHEAFAMALTQWQQDGIPGNPAAWLVSTGRFKAIDVIRRRTRFDASLGTVAKRLDDAAATNAARSEQEIEDDRLRLIFTCCHPALALDSQVALTLREVCGLTTEEIASAFLTAAPTIAQRIVRGKAKIKMAAIPFVVPSKADIHDRLESVLSVIYLVFNEGYYASSGEMLMRADLSDEAIRLGRLLVELLPDPEALGLLALMLFTESKIRIDPVGTEPRSKKESAWSKKRSRPSMSGSTRSKPRLPQPMRMPPTRNRPTGLKSSVGTTFSFRPINHQSSN